jgi:glycosyltransferase involved in cell wall biosynthesis
MTSIITAIFKSENYLAEYILHLKKFANILLAKQVAFEVLIISTFPSVKELELLKNLENCSWCKIHQFNSRGIYAAWNEGVSLAQGNLITPWNVDDIRFPNAIIEAGELVKRGADIVYFPFYLKRYLVLGPISFPVVTRKIVGDVLKFEKRKFEITMTAGPHFMFTKKSYEKVGPFDEQFKIAGDFDWCTRATFLNQQFVCAKEFSGIFRVDGRGLSAGRNRTLQAENNIVFMRRQALEKITPGLEDLVKDFQVDKLRYRNQLINIPD